MAFPTTAAIPIRQTAQQPVAQLAATDADNDALTFSFGQPATALTSGGVAVTWQGDGTNTLVGKVGNTNIITLTIDNPDTTR